MAALACLAAGPGGATWLYEHPHPTGLDLHAVWGASERDVWAAGDDGVVLRFDGSTWAVAHSGGKTLHALWGSRADDVWAAGEEGTLLRWNGRAWTAVASGTSVHLYDIAGTWADDVWVVGASGTVLHFDGRVWSPTASGTQRPLLAVTALSRDRVWAAGAGAMVIRWNGRAWSQLGVPADYLPYGTAPDSSAFTAVATAGAHELWLASRVYEIVPSDPPFPVPLAHLLHFDGKAWQVSRSLDNTVISGIWIRGPRDGWAVSQQEVLRFDGQSWLVVGGSLDDVDQKLRAAWGDGKGAWAVGTAGTLIRAEPGGIVHRARRSSESWRSLSGTGPDDVWAVGAKSVFHRDHRGWRQVEGVPEDVYQVVWASAVDDVWVLGNRASHFDGRRWSTYHLPDAGGRIVAAWGSARNSVWAIDSDVSIVRWNGRRWSTVLKMRGEDQVRHLWGSGPRDVWAVGTAVFHFDGSRWRRVRDAPEELGLVTGTGPRDIWAISTEGLVHFDGRRWSVASDMSAFSESIILALRASGSRDLWAAGNAMSDEGRGQVGFVLHFDGRVWRRSFHTRTGHDSLNALWGSGDDLWAAGSNGTIVRWTPLTPSLSPAVGAPSGERGPWPRAHSIAAGSFRAGGRGRRRSLPGPPSACGWRPRASSDAPPR